MTDKASKFLRFLVVGLIFALVLQLGSCLMFSGGRTAPDAVSAEAEGSFEETRIWSEIDPQNPTRVNLEVDYSSGTQAAWWPKGESPLLSELVEKGELPGVEERVGPEPLVMRGAEGIGEYGGTWLRIGNSEGDGIGVLGSRLSYGSLLRFSPQGLPVVPHVAKGFEVSEDNRVFTFYFRRGAKWSDGHSLTARDALYFWEDEVLDPTVFGTPPGWLLVQGEAPEVTAPDDYTLRFEFPHPYGLFLYHMATAKGAMFVNSPRHYLEKLHPRLGDEELIAREMKNQNSPSPEALYRSMKMISNTEHPRVWPWIYRSYTSNGPYSFVRNPYYFAVDEAGNQLPYIDSIFSEVKNPDMVSISAAAGGTSMQARHIRFEQYTFLMDQRERGGYDVYHWYPGDRSQYNIHVNINRKAAEGHPDQAKKAELLKDLDFRKALSLAVDRQRIIDAEYRGITRPATVAPGPASPFHDPVAYKAFSDYRPEEANRLLDGIGLDKRDFQGYRLYRDGTPLTFYLSFTSFTGSGPAQFLVEDWANVGVRVIPRERSRLLFEAETSGLQHDMAVWIGNGEFFPISEPRQFAPVNAASYFGIGYSRWYVLGGLHGKALVDSPGAIEPPPGSPARRSLEIYDALSAWSDLEKVQQAFKEMLRLAMNQVWTINISTPPPVLAVVADNMRNVPKDVVYSWDFQSPGNAGPETFWLSEDLNRESTRDQLQASILKPELPTGAGSSTASVEELAADASGKRFQTFLAWLFRLIGVGLVLLVAFRHPFIARRLLIMIPTLLIISVIVFTVIQLPPGDYVTSEIIRLRETGDQASMQRVEEMQKLFHLEKPMFERYLRWMGVYWFASFDQADTGLLQGDLGRSMQSMRPVGEIVGDRVLLTFLISLGTVLFTWSLAIPIGIYSAVKQYTISDYFITFFGFIGMCIPGFLLALLLMYAGSEWFGITVTGLFSPEYATQVGWSMGKFIDLLKHIWIPIAVMGINGTAAMIRIMRANLLDELCKPYVVTARAKGMRPIRLLMKYPVRLALNPFVSGIGGLFPQLVSGGAIVAMVLSLPTVGPLMLSALFAEDMYLAGSMLMVLSLLGVVGTLVSDLLLMWLDPRIRMGGK